MPMPYGSDGRLTKLEGIVSSIKDMLRSISGIPAIKAHANCLLSLNDNLDVQQLNKTLADFEKRIAECERLIKTVGGNRV